MQYCNHPGFASPSFHSLKSAEGPKVMSSYPVNIESKQYIFFYIVGDQIQAEGKSMNYILYYPMLK